MTKSDILTKIVVPILCALGSGIGVWFFTSDWETTARSRGWVSLPEWQTNARKEGWIPREECPAYPLKLQLVSPGDAAEIRVNPRSNEATLYTDIVVRASRPVPEATDVGLVYSEEGTSRYFVDFPYFDVDDARKLFRDEQFISIPFTPSATAQLNIWAIAVDDKRTLGTNYADIEQVLNASPGIVLSEKITVSLKADE